MTVTLQKDQVRVQSHTVGRNCNLNLSLQATHTVRAGIIYAGDLKAYEAGVPVLWLAYASGQEFSLLTNHNPGTHLAVLIEGIEDGTVIDFSVTSLRRRI